MRYEIRLPEKDVRAKLLQYGEMLRSRLKARLEGLRELEEAMSLYSDLSEEIYNYLIEAFASSSGVASKFSIYSNENLVWEFGPDNRDFKQRIQSDLATIDKLISSLDEPPDSVPTLTREFFPVAALGGVKDYVAKIITQINVCYEYKCYDACGTMMRRLLETLLIEIYVHQSRADDIRKDGKFLMLTDMAKHALNDGRLSLTREPQQKLIDLVEFGHRCAHSPKVNAKQFELDERRQALMNIAAELASLSAIRV